MMLEEIAGVTPQELEDHRNRMMQLYTKLAEALIQARKEAAPCGNTEQRKEPTVTIQIDNDQGVFDENALAIHRAVLAAVKHRKCMRERDERK